MNLLVDGAAESFHPEVSPTDGLCPICHSVLRESDAQSTLVHLDSTDQWWQADNFKTWIHAAFLHGRWANIRIQSLTFNGEVVFDYRLWPEPPALEPITVKVQKANIPEWKERT